MHDALWLAYIATFIKQWGLTSATGFMWALVPEVIAYGELKSGKRNAAIINAIMGIFFKIIYDWWCASVVVAGRLWL
jgi:GPH family glycoside/pentoside/hexuronide:cation symporter